MGQTLTNLTVHLIFSIKNGIPMINEALRPELLAYMGGIMRGIKCKPLKINGTSDHVHLLVEIVPIVSIAKLVRMVKTNSSGWVHQNRKLEKQFAWQTGYGAFSVSKSAVPTVTKYIEEQEIHHQKQSFQAEFLTFLKNIMLNMMIDIFGVRNYLSPLQGSRLLLTLILGFTPQATNLLPRCGRRVNYG